MKFRTEKLIHIARERDEKTANVPAGTTYVEVISLIELENGEPVIAFYDSHAHSLRLFGQWYPTEEEKLDFVKALLLEKPTRTETHATEAGVLKLLSQFILENSDPAKNLNGKEHLLVKGCGAFQVSGIWRAVKGSQSDFATAVCA